MRWACSITWRSTSTMSTTSDAGAAAQDNPGAGDASSYTQSSRWFVPDEQTLARLMSEMFRSSPGATAPVPASYVVSATQAPPPFPRNPEESTSLPAAGSLPVPPSLPPTAVPGVAGIAPNPISIPGPLEVSRPAVSGFGASVPGGPMPLQSPSGTPSPFQTSQADSLRPISPSACPHFRRLYPARLSSRLCSRLPDFRRPVPSALSRLASSGPSYYFLDSTAAPSSQVPNIGASGFDVAAMSQSDFPILSEACQRTPVRLAG